MKKFKCNTSPKVRTVTEIIHSSEKLKKDYDIAEFDAKNLNSLESYNDIKIKSILVKYMAMLNTLQLTQPLLTIFRDRSDQAQKEIFEIVISSLAFVHKRVNPMVNNFNKRMFFSMLDPKDSIPGEPIIFSYNDNDDIVCHIDRISILKSMDKQFDTQMVISSTIQENQKLKLINSFTAPKKHREGESSEYDIRLSETEVTQYLVLLQIIEHAYLHYSVLKNYGLFNYLETLVDHTLFSNKCRPSLNMNISNLMISKFRFTVETTNSSKNIGYGLLSYANN